MKKPLSKRAVPAAKPRPKTSWGGVSDWYDELLETDPDSYQEKVIAPNLMRLLGPKAGMHVLDIACGQGFFSRKFAAAGARVTGADISKELIERARQRSPEIEFHAAPAHRLAFAKNGAFHAATIVLAIQNIEDMHAAFAEAYRALAPDGRLLLVLNHPAFRIPKRSSWGFDQTEQSQYRRVDGYLSPSVSKIDMHPGANKHEQTVSYHRSLQDFFKALHKTGFAVTRLEEWISHKKSQAGPRQKAEDAARKEIPLFMAIEASK